MSIVINMNYYLDTGYAHILICVCVCDVPDIGSYVGGVTEHFPVRKNSFWA